MRKIYENKLKIEQRFLSQIGGDCCLGLVYDYHDVQNESTAVRPLAKLSGGAAARIKIANVVEISFVQLRSRFCAVFLPFFF